MKICVGSAITKYTYDAAQRLVAVSNNTGERVDYTLNAAGDRTAEAIRNPSATITRTMTRVFDELSRLRQHLGANSQDMGYTWDDNNNLVGMDDALGRQTVQDYDALDRLIRITDPAVQDTALDYDARDNLIAVTDPIGVTTTYVHDGLDNLIQESSPDIGTTTHVYDTAGNRIQSTDARGVVVQYTYDALNRQLTTTYPGSTSENAVFTYDAGTNGKGQLTSLTDPAGTTTCREGSSCCNWAAAATMWGSMKRSSCRREAGISRSTGASCFNPRSWRAAALVGTSPMVSSRGWPT